MGFFNRTTSSDLLNEAHTLGLGALQAFEDLAMDLEVAANLADQHGQNAMDAVTQLQQERDSAFEASDRFATAAGKIRSLVS